MSQRKKKKTILTLPDLEEFLQVSLSLVNDVYV